MTLVPAPAAGGLPGTVSAAAILAPGSLAVSTAADGWQAVGDDGVPERGDLEELGRALEESDEQRLPGGHGEERWSGGSVSGAGRPGWLLACDPGGVGLDLA